MPAFSQYRPYLLWGFGITALFIILATLAYSLFFGGDNTNPPEGGTFPAGEGRTTGTLPGNTGSPGNGTSSGGVEDQLFQMHDRPVVSSVSFVRAGYPYTRFMEEGSGHVYEYDLRNRREYRISNTSIPQIAEALWSTDGTIVAFRYEDGGVMKAAVGELSTTTEERAFLKVHFLPEGIKSLGLSPNGRSIFYILNNQPSGGAVGIAANRDGSSPRTIFSSKLSHWLASWSATNTILVTSPWSASGGVVYQVNPQTGSQSIVFSTEGSFVGASGGPRGEILVSDPATGHISSINQSGSLIREVVLSWPSFCSFSSGATSTVVCADLPTQGRSLFSEWARGEYDFVSNLAVINLEQGLTIFPLRLEDMQDRSFDMTNPSISPDGSYASFKNRPDGRLWGVVLTNQP